MMLKKIGKIILFIVITLTLLEGGMWLVGFRPYTNHDYKLSAFPNTPFVGHDSLGLALNPGKYEITLNDSLKFNTTHLDNGLRLTNATHESGVRKIHALGCSFTYGYGVNDDQTFCSVLQKNNPDVHVSNHGVVGYGTVQSYLQLQQLDLRPNDLVILCFSSHHFIRNTLSREYRSHLKIGFENSSRELDKNMGTARFPYINDCSSEVQFESWNLLYHYNSWRDIFASVNYAHTIYDDILDDKELQTSVSSCIIQKMDAICDSKNARLVVAILDQTEDTRTLESSIPDIDILNLNFDFADHSLTNYPCDSHPNANGHKMIAGHLQAVLDITPNTVLASSN